VSQRADIPHQRLSASFLPPEVEPEERDLMRLLEKAVAPSYTLVKRLGAGGMGSVYLARDPVLKRLVAVKIMAARLAADETARARFEREAQAVASISHPNVVAVYSVGELENGVPYLVMQYIQGRTMSERLAQDGPLDARSAKRVLGEISSALAAAHRKGIIHRDIKPANILLDDDTGRAMVTDFGIAAVLERDEDDREPVGITHKGRVVGTPAYMSPEQLLEEHVTEKTDIYSLGLLGYELFIGEGPYRVSSPREFMAAHLRDTPRRLWAMRADIEPELARLLEGCLTKDPAKRPTAAEVESRLAHGASVLLEWPPPGLEHLAADLRVAVRFLWIGAFATGLSVVVLSLFDRDSVVRQSLPPTLAITALAGVGLILFAVGLVGLGRFLRIAQTGVNLGYGWWTVLEAAVDGRKDTGALITGGREYAELAPEIRSRMRRLRLVAGASRVAAGLMPLAGFAIGLLLAARSSSGPTIVLWASLVLSLTLLAVSRAVAWQEERVLSPARIRLRTASFRSEGLPRLAEAWTTAFEQVRDGQSLGAGTTKHATLISRVSTAILALVGAAGLALFLVLSQVTVVEQIASIAYPEFSSVRARVARVQRLATLRIPPDTTVSPLRAGQALHAIARNGPGGRLHPLEKQPAISIPAQPRTGSLPDPFQGSEGGWVKEAFRQAPRGFNIAQRDFLKAMADNSALEEFRLLSRAPAMDLAAAFWDIAPGEEPMWYSLPIPRYTFLRTAANANAAQAALDFAAGRRDDAERRLRENISVGVLMMDGHVIIENVVGANIVAGARESLVVVYDLTGRAREARAIVSEADPVITVVQPTMRFDVGEINRMLARVVLDEQQPPGVRWEMLASLTWAPCSDMHQVLFGPDESHTSTLAAARASLVHRSSDSLLFALMVPSYDADGPTRSAGHHPVARIISALTGNRQAADCLWLLGLRGEP
jgi:tRNA A-37 threonylcarbamoyl transferase component Bud32